MTLLSAVNRDDFTGNGAAGTYAYPFKVFSESDLVVVVKKTSTGDETTLVISTDYTVTGVGETLGGNIVLVDSSQDWLDAEGDLDTGWTMTVRRVRAIVQEADIRNQGDYFPETQEDAFDKAIMIDQQQQGELDRTLKVKVTYTGDPIVVPDPETDKVLTWDSDGQLQNTDLTQTDTASLADGSVTNPKIGADAVDGDKIEDDAVDSEHIAAGAVDLAHMSVNSVDSDQYVDASIDYAHLSAALIAAITAANNPIGTVRTFGVSTDPETLLGFTSTWTPIDGTVIVGKAAAGTFDTLDATGGAETHTLTEAELASHDHPFTAYVSGVTGFDGSGTKAPRGDATTQNTSTAGSGTAHNNLQPYIVKYVWQRTA